MKKPPSKSVWPKWTRKNVSRKESKQTSSRYFSKLATVLSNNGATTARNIIPPFELQVCSFVCSVKNQSPAIAANTGRPPKKR